MLNFEKIINKNAERRKNKAENKSELSISHYGGDLHVHTGRHPTEETPENVLETRRGSNCGDVPLKLLIKYHSQEMKDKFIAISDHSRDAWPEKALEGIINWFYNMYRWNNNWVLENYHKTKEELSRDNKNEIREKAKEMAKKVALYGDERLEQILQEIDEINQNKELPIRILKGIEVNLLPDGAFDTQMVRQGKFELVNCSIHPNVDERFDEIIKDPEKYSNLVVKGINNPKTNVICHIGRDVPQGDDYDKKSSLEKIKIENEFNKKLDWEKITNEAMKNNVAIEINIQKLMRFLYEEILNYEKFPKGDIDYQKVFKEKLNEFVPIVSSEKIGRVLKEKFKQGLKIAINTDEHSNKFVKAKNVTKDSYDEVIKDRDFRFWRCMKIAEEYFNQLFNALGIKKENIINTFSAEELEKFIKKNEEKN